MSTPPDQVEATVDAALDLPVAERAAYLDQVCGDNPPLRQLVEALLRAHGHAPAPGSPRPPAREFTAAKTLPLSEKPGDMIGPYKLLQQIGEGGCGVVYMAEQESPVRRRVALKVIKLGMDTKQVIARFEAERQALALMDHPNIAKVLEAGASKTGRPFFVMELVRGIKITDYCDQNNLPTEKRLELFIQVCKAVQHAHQKGIIHRDIKPSNILVTLHDGVPVPKVIDFGIAKATEQRLTDKTLFTALEQFIGTPAYMSPEQAEMSGLDIDTRSDIYSLGVLLYELLTGQMPFNPKTLMKAGLDEMRRIIREQDPVRPSTRLSSLDAADQTTVARRRQVAVPKLLHLIRGDLDWIVMKCLEKDRTRRYETANGLARDIERHLGNEPVVASPPNRAYRFRKMLHRHKLAFGAAGMVLASLLFGLGLSTWLFLIERATRQRAETSEKAQVASSREAQAEKQKAETEAAKSREIARFLQNMLKGVRPETARGRDTTLLKEILDSTLARLEVDLTNHLEVQGELLATIGQVYVAMGAYTNAEAAHKEALDKRRKGLGNQHYDVAVSLLDVARACYEQTKLPEAEAAARQAVSILKNLQHNDLAIALNDLGLYLEEQGKLSEAEEAARESVALVRQLKGPDREVATSLDNLAGVLWREGKLQEAEDSYRQVLKLDREHESGDSRGTATTLNNLGFVLHDAHKLDEAEAVRLEVYSMLKRLLGEEHPYVASALNNLGREFLDHGKSEKAEEAFGNALQMRRKLLGAEDPDVAISLEDLGLALKRRGKLSEAEQAFRESTEIREKKTPDSWLAFRVKSLHGGVLLALQRNAEAETVLLASFEGLAQRKSQSPSGSGRYLKETAEALVELYRTTARPEEASTWKLKAEELAKGDTQAKPGGNSR